MPSALSGTENCISAPWNPLPGDVCGCEQLEECHRGWRHIVAVVPTPSSCSMTDGCLTFWSSRHPGSQGRDGRTLASSTGETHPKANSVGKAQECVHVTECM